MTEGSLDPETRALLALNLTQGIGQTRAGALLAHFGTAEAAIETGADQWMALEGMSRAQANKLKGALERTLDSDAIASECQLMAEHGISLVSTHDPGYPRLLRLIPDPPPLLWMRGELQAHDALALAIIGSRRCTHYGREQADRFAAHAAQAGLCVISGGAQGIDAAAHRAALRHGGRTIAAIGSGLANPYPKAHRELFDEIAEGEANRGALLSELPMTTPARADNFPRRNRIISGLALGVLVVEAAARSGALITARLCVEEHARELMAIPGRVDSRASDGCHKMIREGWARLVTGGADMLDALGETGQILKTEMVQLPQGMTGDAAESASAREEDSDASPFNAKLSDAQKRIVEALSQPRSLDQLVATTELPTHQVQSELTLLELQGHIERCGGLLKRRR